MAKSKEPLPPEVMAAFERHKPLEAIKLLLASRANAALTAKPPAVQQSGRTSGNPKTSAPAGGEFFAPKDGLSPGEVPRSNSSFWAWVIVALLVYLAFRLVHG